MQIKITASKISGSTVAPPSKSYTHRAVILASLGHGVSTIKNPLISDDTKTTIKAAQALGADISFKNDSLIITGQDGFQKAKPKKIIINCQDSGTTLRLIASLTAISPYISTLDGSLKLAKRPINDLFKSLREQGIVIKDANGYLPATIYGNHLKGGQITISGSISSQFISSLLIVLPFAQHNSTLIVNNLRSKPYVDITIDCMRKFGIDIIENGNIFYIPRGNYKSTIYKVEGDFSSASYFMGIAAVTGNSLIVSGLNPKSKQGDKVLIDILKEIGCTIKILPDGFHISAKANKPLSIDMGNYPDIVPTLAAIAATIDGRTQITNIGHLRQKESNRIETIKNEFSKFGARITSSNDSLTITGNALHGALINTHNDHRIAMSATILALASKGDTIINDAQVVEKSYQNFWLDLEKIGVNLKPL